VAGHIRLELGNVGAKYLFEMPHGSPGIQPNSGLGDYSRVSRDVEDTQLTPGVPGSHISSEALHGRLATKR
jgi:hypothetical protein